MFNDIAHQYADLGKKDKAIAILSQSLEIAKKIEDTSVRVTLMLGIAKIYFDLNLITIANNILSETLEIADSI
jgi:tetratricopeptide (TPR) repeat protein